MSVWSRLDDFDPVDLDELDRRASLQRRVDHKYLVDSEVTTAVLDDLRADHDVLEIDGDRSFAYRSVYFDTPELTCFSDHIRDRRPRYKLRTRHYVTTRGCVFEVKVKREDGETKKRSIDYASEDRLTDPARDLIDETLGRAGAERPSVVQPTLVTQFTRSTLALREGGERATVDREVRLSCAEGESLVMHEGHALFETKTEHGAGRCDRVLADAGAEPRSFSKYRLGVGRLLTEEDADYGDELMRFFAREPTPPGDRAAAIFGDRRSAAVAARAG